jgi:hypothetical protein
MKTFVVSVNGKRLCRAGIGQNGVLTAIVNWVGGGSQRTAEGHFGFHVGGLDSRTGEHVGWAVPELQLGDEVTIRLEEGDQIDPECRREKAGAMPAAAG